MKPFAILLHLSYCIKSFLSFSIAKKQIISKFTWYDWTYIMSYFIVELLVFSGIILVTDSSLSNLWHTSEMF